MLSRGARPALARKLRQRERGVAVDHHLDVVERPIGLAGRIEPMRIVDPVLAGIPAADRQIEPAGECERIVDHDDLLVLRGAGRHRIVETEAHARRRIPAERERRERLALQRIEHRIVPGEQVHGQLGPLVHELRQKLAQRDRPAVVRLAVLADEPRAAVEIPADDEDVALRLQQRLAHRAEERARVDQHRGARRALDAPYIAAWLEHAHGAPKDEMSSGSQRREAPGSSMQKCK